MWMRHIGRWQDGPLVTRVLLLLSLQQKVSSWCLRPVALSDRGACPPHQTLHPGVAQTHTHTQSGAPPGQQYMIYGFKQPPRVIYKVFRAW